MSYQILYEPSDEEAALVAGITGYKIEHQLVKVKNPLSQLFVIEITLVIYFELLNLTHHHDC